MLTRQEFHNESGLSSAHFLHFVTVRLAAQIAAFSEHTNKIQDMILNFRE